jgi:hypothetical protein
VDARRCIRPHGAVGPHERLHLSRRQIETLFPQSGQGFEGIPKESKSILLVREQSSDDQLNCFLRHGIPTRHGKPGRVCT